MGCAPRLGFAALCWVGASALAPSIVGLRRSLTPGCSSTMSDASCRQQEILVAASAMEAQLEGAGLQPQQLDGLKAGLAMIKGVVIPTRTGDDETEGASSFAARTTGGPVTQDVVQAMYAARFPPATAPEEEGASSFAASTRGVRVTQDVVQNIYASRFSPTTATPVTATPTTATPKTAEPAGFESATKIGSLARERLVKPFDCLVVGGGPAGVAGALRAAFLGKRVLVVDRPKAAPPQGGLDPFFGGPTGLFSKALRDCSKTLDVNGFRTQGLDDDVIWKQIQNQCTRLAQNNAQQQLKLLPQESGTGDVAVRVTPVDSDIGEVTVHANRALLCTGSVPVRFGGIPFDNQRIFDADSINGLDYLPKSVVIVGSGIIAIEYAKIMKKIGAEVTMLVRGSASTAMARLGIDKSLASGLLQDLADEGIDVRENTQVEDFLEMEPAVGCERPPVRLALMDGDKVSLGEIQCDLFLAATGRTPNTKANVGLNLEAAGVGLTDRGHIDVDVNGATSRSNVFAAGDCVPGPALASTGADGAQRAVSFMFEAATQVDKAASFPVGVWTMPEVGYYGLTKEAAIAKGHDADEGEASYDLCLRGRVFAPNGMLKLVFDRDTTEVLGVHIIGTDACELVHYGMQLVDSKTTIFDIISSLFTAVTFHELFKEAALNGNAKLEFGLQWQEVQIGRAHV